MMWRSQGMLGALSLVMLAAATPPPPAHEWTVFGLDLGKPLSIPECHHKVGRDGLVFSTYEDDPAETCYEPDIELNGSPPWRRGAVNFPLKKMPLILHINSGNTLIVDGKLEGLEFDTLNYGNASGIITELSAKFGRPTSVIRTTASPAGIVVPSIEAQWKVPGLHVTYRSIDDSVEYGELEIETAKLQFLRLEANRKQSREQIHL